MKKLRHVIAGLLVLLTCSCEILNLVPRSTVSRTDVASQGGGPSAEILIDYYSDVLQREASGVPALPAWGSYRNFWLSVMDTVRESETAEFYDRVFRDFPDARKNLGLQPIPVRPYNQANRVLGSD